MRGVVGYYAAIPSDLIVLWWYKKQHAVTKLGIFIATSCAVSIVCIFAGWIMYMLGEPPYFYNALAFLPLSIVLYGLFSRGSCDFLRVDGGLQLGAWISRFHFFDSLLSARARRD